VQFVAAADADNDNNEDARNGMRVLLQLSVYALTYTDNYTTTLYAFCYLVPARYVLVAYFSFFVCLAEALRDMVTAIVVKFSEYVDGQNPDHYRGGEPRRTADAIYSECGKSTLGDVLRTSAASDVICLVI